MLDSLELFEEISHNEFLENTEFILFLNKHDLFVEKLRTSQLSACFPEYEGTRDELVVTKHKLNTSIGLIKTLITSCTLRFNLACYLVINKKQDENYTLRILLFFNWNKIN